MEQQSTPSSSNGRSFVTPKSRKKSPGDVLGNGKSQLPITLYYSPLSSSSDRSSQPYSPIACSSKAKRRTNGNSPLPNKRRRKKTALLSQKDPVVIVSSDESSDEVFANSKPRSLAVVPKSRLSLVKRQLYPVASSPVSSGCNSSRPKKKLLPKRRSRVLSDSDSEDVVPTVPKQKSRAHSGSYSEGVVPMEKSQNDTKPLLDVAVQSSQANRVRRRLCPETSSQAVVISSSDDSDFELLTSKPSQSLLSQSFCGQDAPRSSQKSYLSSQTNRVGCTKTASFIGKPPTGSQKPKKRCSLGNSFDSTSYKSSCDTNSTTRGLDVTTSSGKLQKALIERPSDNPDGGEDSLRGDLVKSEYVHDESEDDDESQVPLIPTHNGDDPSIYLQDTLPFLDAAIDPVTDNHLEICKTQVSSGSSAKRDVCRNTPHRVSTDSSSHHAAASQSSVPDDSIYFENTVDPGMNPDAAMDFDETVDFSDKPLSNAAAAPLANEAVNPDAALDSNKTVDFPHKTFNGINAATLGNDTGVDPEATCDWDATDFSDKPLSSAAAVALAKAAVNPEAVLGSEKTVDFSHKTLPNSIIAGIDPEATFDWDPTVDFSHKSSSTPSAPVLADGLDTPSPGCFKKGAVIEPSDDDESIMDQNQADQSQVSKKNRISLGVIPLSELLNVTHISGSDYSDDDLSVVPGSPNPLAADMASLLVEGSDDSSGGITSVMKSMMASNGILSDVVASFEASEEPDQGEYDKEAGEVESQYLSPTEGIVNIALDVTGLEKDSCSVDGTPGAVTADKLGSNGRMSVAPEDATEPLQKEASLVHDVENATPTPLQPSNTLPGYLANPVTDCVDVVAAPGNASRGTEDGIDLTCAKTDCSDSGRSAMPEESCVSPIHKGENASPIPLTGISADGALSEMKIVCGSQCTSADTARIHITQNIEKTLLHNPNKLLLDTIITECQNYASHVLTQEPIKSFLFQYSNLPRSAKLALHGCLLELLEDSNRWLKYQELSAASINTLVSSGILEYLNSNDDLITKIHHLDFSEITEVLCKLGNFSSNSIETMRNIVIIKVNSAYTCERIRKAAIDLINRKFVKLTESACFCIKICLELFVLPLNLCDKLYKTVEIARYANNLIRKANCRFLLLPLKTNKIVMNADRVLYDLSALCRLKSGVFGSALNDESIYLRVNDICSSIAVLNLSAESDPSTKDSPTFRFVMTNYVHALDEQLKTLLYYNTSNVDVGPCFYLAVLLQQNVTGFQHKVKWCRERMRYLEQLFTASFFAEFSQVLKEPVSPVQFMVRSEFVANALKIKKCGLSPDEKSHLMKLLRPISHKRTPLAYMPLNSYLTYYPVLTKKPKGKNFNMIRANIFETHKSEFPCGFEDNGSLLLNAIFLTFWQVIYQNIEGMFLNKFQNKPLDWGSEEFFSRRENSIKNLVLEMEKLGLPSVFKSINTIFDQFSSHHCIIDWQLVTPNMTKMTNIVETLGLDKFLKISVYVLGKLDERVLGFPDIVLWNPESKKVQFLTLRKPADLYPYQVLWLEKLSDFGLDAAELLMSGYTGPEQCSQLK